MLSPAFATELSICGFYSRRPAYRQAGYEACARLTTDRRLAPEMRRMALENFRFYARPARELYPSFEQRQLSLEVPTGWSICNPSLFMLKGQMWGIVRSVNYKVDSGRYSSPNGVIETRNYLVRYDKGEIVEHWHIAEKEPPFSNSKIRGTEDLRPNVVGNDIFVTGTVCDHDQNMQRQIALFRLVDKRLELLHVHQSSRAEKNWAPISGTDLWLYCMEPTAIVRWDGERFVEHSVTVPPFGLDQIKGGSQVVHVKEDLWLTVTHETVFPAPPARQYLHRFVILQSNGNGQFAVSGVSFPFYLIHQGIEFVAGAVLMGSRLVVSFGKEDAEAFLCWFDIDEVLASIQ